MNSEDKIRLETDAVSIVAALMWYGNDERLIWTQRIIAEVLAKPVNRVEDAIGWLRKNTFVTTHRGQYIVTEQGRGYYEAAKRNPHGMVSGADAFKWKEEALTGITEYRSRKSKMKVTCRSEISRGVLPTRAPEPERRRTPEDVMSDYENKTRILQRTAMQLGIRPDQVIEFWNKDKIRVCEGGGQSHLGLFDSGNTVCRKCMKKRGKNVKLRRSR